VNSNQTTFEMNLLLPVGSFVLNKMNFSYPTSTKLCMILLKVESWKRKMIHYFLLCMLVFYSHIQSGSLLRVAALPGKCKAKDSAKFALILDWPTDLYHIPQEKTASCSVKIFGKQSVGVDVLARQFSCKVCEHLPCI